MNTGEPKETLIAHSPVERLIRFCLENRMIVYLVSLAVIAWGLMVAPFDWDVGRFPRYPLHADAIPDIGEDQQIVFTEWAGRSPQDVESQITYPLSTVLMGIPEVKTIRCFSTFGFSSIHVLFNEGAEFYWSRTRLLEKLNSLPAGTLPSGVQPVLGPDATPLGQIFWYTLEGRDPNGRPAGGWDLHELRTIQDFYVRYALTAAGGVSEVASAGGFVREYHVDVDPDRLLAHQVTLDDVVQAVRRSNIDVGANTVEINRVDYYIRGIGFLKGLDDLRDAVVSTNNSVPITLENIARVTFGPAGRPGALDKNGAEAVGGVVVARFGENPMAVLSNIKKKIQDITPGLPRKTLPDGTESQVRIVPFYDRSGLIQETLGTLQSALTEEILVTVIVVTVMLMHLGGSLLICGLLPVAVLLCFAAMKLFRVDANIVALSGIAIAIGTMVDMGIIIVENIARHMQHAEKEESALQIVFKSTAEVGGAVLTAVSTMIASFLPVFMMEGAEGKLFRPLAFTKTMALAASIVLALTIVPPLAHAIFSQRMDRWKKGWILHEGLLYLGVVLFLFVNRPAGIAVAVVGAYKLLYPLAPLRYRRALPKAAIVFTSCAGILLLAHLWMPLGVTEGLALNLLFVAALIGAFLALFQAFLHFYPRILGWCLRRKRAFLSLPLLILLLGATVWLGFDTLFGWMPGSVRSWQPVSFMAHRFPGLSKEFMPPLDEGSFLFMPVTMPHASIGEAMDVLQTQDKRLSALPEVQSTVGKIGRAESPLDPAPVSMIETVINYHPEFLTDARGRRPTFDFDPDQIDWVRNPDGELVSGPDGKPYLVRGSYRRDAKGKLTADENGRPFRIWRPPLDPRLNRGREPWEGIRSSGDIWAAIVKAAQIPGTTTAPKLQPISARIVMLQSGIAANMGVRISGPDLETVQGVALELEKQLREVPSIEPATVIADRMIGKPYLEIHIDRGALVRYGLQLQQVQEVIESAIGGRKITTTVEGRERYAVRVRYMRELRNDVDALGRVLVPTLDGAQIPLRQMASLQYVRGPQVIKSEDTFLVGYVLFEKKSGFSDVDVVEQAKKYLNDKINSRKLMVPAGVSFSFAGTYENQVRAEKKLSVILPLSLLLVFLILYLQFRSAATSLLVFCGISVAWAAGFIMLWLYAQPWFMDFSLFGTPIRELFHIHSINLSVAVWVGFLALFGVATDDGVIMATYLDRSFAGRSFTSVEEIRQATIEAGKLRIRPCLMTTATTVLALLPVLTSTGRGSDIMIPMAIPSFGGMILATITVLTVPVLYCAIRERRLKSGGN
jgi:copper/silver efflux system protein